MNFLVIFGMLIGGSFMLSTYFYARNDMLKANFMVLVAILIAMVATVDTLNKILLAIG